MKFYDRSLSYCRDILTDDSRFFDANGKPDSTLLNQMCTNNCSNNGNCSNGKYLT